jgi:hypothetical protein
MNGFIGNRTRKQSTFYSERKVEMSTPKKKQKKVAPKKEPGLNIKELIRDAEAGKVNKVKFTDILLKHYKGKGREDAWIQKRIKQLWQETGK